MLTCKPRKRWLEKIEAFRSVMAGDLKEEIEKGVGEDGKLLMKTVISKLSDLTEGKDLIVPDVGQHQMMASRFYNFQTENSFFCLRWSRDHGVLSADGNRRQDGSS